MAKITGPLLSLSASGTIASSMTYSRWKGIGYVRQRVIPANPNTAAQQGTRQTFSWLNAVARQMDANLMEAWEAYAGLNRMTARNAIIRFNLADLIGEADLTNVILSPPVRNGPPIASAPITPGSEELEIAPVAPTLPTGWSIDQAFATAIRDQDPQSGTLYASTTDVDTASPWSITLTGLTASVDYVVGVWFRYLRPDLTYAYGQSFQQVDQPNV